jgi:hypothetical protein
MTSLLLSSSFQEIAVSQGQNVTGEFSNQKVSVPKELVPLKLNKHI